MALIEGVAEGDLSGTGRWSFTHDSGVTTVRYEWKVTTSKRWMNLLASIARPIFRWNHDAVMRSGAEGLARKLKAEVISDE